MSMAKLPMKKRLPRVKVRANLDGFKTIVGRPITKASTKKKTESSNATTKPLYCLKKCNEPHRNAPGGTNTKVSRLGEWGGGGKAVATSKSKCHARKKEGKNTP